LRQGSGVRAQGSVRASVRKARVSSSQDKN
jgi:hypothetical protein